MKKKIFSIVLLCSTTLLTVEPVVLNAHADQYDTQIQEKNKEVNNLKSQESAAQTKVDEIQEKVDAIQSKSEKLKTQNKTLEKENEQLTKEANELSRRITERTKTIQRQARSVQTEGAGTNYLDVLLEAHSLSDAIARIQAVSRIVSANKDLLVEQKSDKQDLDVKQKDNAVKIKTLWENQRELENQAESMKTQQAELKAAQIGLALSRATAEKDIESLKGQQAQAQAQAQKIAAEEAARAEAEAAKKIKAAEYVKNTVTQVENVEKNTEDVAETPEIPVVSGGGHYNSSPGSYPEGQCTWYVKSVFGSRVGDYWGNGGDWAASAAADGYTVSSTPAAGTVAVFPPGVAGASGYGHVAVVNSYSGGKITITEMNWAGQPGVTNTRTISPAGVMFVYV